ncbi:transporter substrate-binding domain-containing protein [Kitasatospora sp. NPDC097643]|uniref:substrate-binding periplasmic protein n=1 Tax=Kitasatospora sp. NPDC097643 TaxID=3157230 RepID=UPI0033229B32
MITGRPLRLLAAAVVLMQLALVAACSSGADLPAPFDGRVQVGFKTAMPGMAVQMTNGIFQGFEPKLVEKVLGDAGVKYSAVPVAATTWEDALVDGNTNHNGVDLVVADVSDTAERESKFDLAGPYLKTQLGALTSAAHPAVVKRQEDLVALRVCTVAKTTARALVDNEVKPKVSLDGQSPQDCLAALDGGTADVFVSDYLVLRGIAVNVKVNGQPPYAITEGKFGKVQFLVAALPKGHSAACQWLRSRLDTYMKSQAWVDGLRSSFSFEPQVTDDNLRQDFQPMTSAADNLCAA